MQHLTILDNGGETEKMYAGVTARVINPNPDSPFVLVEPSVKKCPLVGNILVLKTSVNYIKR